MVVLKVLLYLVLITLPFGAVVRINVISSAYIYPVDIAVFFVFLWFLVKLLKKREIPSRLLFFKSLVLFIGFAFLSLVLNSFRLTLLEFFISFLYLLRIAAYFSLLFIFDYLDSDAVKRFKFLFLMSGFIAVFFGFVQYFFYPSLRNLYYLGWDEHLYRMFSTFLDPNFAGAFFVLELLLILNFLPKMTMKSISFQGVSLLLMTLFTLLAIFLTYSRSSFVMLIISLISFLVLAKKKSFFIIVIFSLAMVVLIIPKDFEYEGLNPLRIASIEGRVESIQRALIIFQDSPIYGVGFNAYRYAQKRYGFLDERWEETHAGSGVSNSIVFTLVTTGVVGLFLYLKFWYGILRALVIAGRSFSQSSDNYFFPTVIASIIGVFVHGMFENTLFYPSIMLWIFSLIGIYFKTPRD